MENLILQSSDGACLTDFLQQLRARIQNIISHLLSQAI